MKTIINLNYYSFFNKIQLLIDKKDYEDAYEWFKLTKDNPNVENIEEHLNEEPEKGINGRFDGQKPIKDLFLDVQEKLIDARPDERDVCERYFVDMDDSIGYVNGRPTRRIVVVVIPSNSFDKHILTMYPVADPHNFYDFGKVIVK